MRPIVENVWEQIQNQGILKNDHTSKVRAKTVLKSFTDNYLDFDIKQFISGSKSIKTLRKLKDKCLFRKPDKGQGIVLVNRDDYNDLLENLFNDTKKFQLLDHDTTIRSLSTVPNYLNILHNRHKTTLEHKNAMRLKLAQVGRAHGLPKIYKDYDHPPPFHQTIDPTNTVHYLIAK